MIGATAEKKVVHSSAVRDIASYEWTSLDLLDLFYQFEVVLPVVGSENPETIRALSLSFRHLCVLPKNFYSNYSSSHLRNRPPISLPPRLLPLRRANTRLLMALGPNLEALAAVVVTHDLSL